MKERKEERNEEKKKKKKKKNKKRKGMEYYGFVWISIVLYGTC